MSKYHVDPAERWRRSQESAEDVARAMLDCIEDDAARDGYDERVLMRRTAAVIAIMLGRLIDSIAQD